MIKIANNEKEALVGKQIRAQEVLVIGPNGEQLGIKKINDALTLASYAGFDLVQVGDKNPPVCKIMDYNKFKYERSKKLKENKKKQKETSIDIKEYRLSVTIDKHDFETKLNQATKYLEKGHKIKAVIRFKGRQMAHPELGKEVLDKFANAASNISEIESQPKLDGRNMFMILTPKK